MRVQPFSFIAKTGPDVTPPVPTAPFTEYMHFWFKDIDNNSSGTTWNDSSPANTSTATLLNGATIISGAAQLDNSVSNATRLKSLRVKPTSTTIDVKSALIVFNQPLVTFGTTSARAYFYDARDANTASPNNAGFFNQYDSVNTTTGSIHGNDATFYAYAEGESTFNGGSITTTLLTNGTSKSNGGSLYYQWLGPNGRNINYTKRVFFFNYNSSLPVNITSVNEGWYLGANSNSSEATSLNIYEVIGYDRALTFTQFEDIIDYLKLQGTIT